MKDYGCDVPLVYKDVQFVARYVKFVGLTAYQSIPGKKVGLQHFAWDHKKPEAIVHSSSSPVYRNEQSVQNIFKHDCIPLNSWFLQDNDASGHFTLDFGETKTFGRFTLKNPADAK